MRGGVFIFEFKNVRPGRAIKFFKRAATKIPTPTKFHFNAGRYIKLNGGGSTNPLVRAY
jgi:ribosomal protein L16/L10AE